jgi:lipopolysaccharide transport system permease protein
MNWPISGAASYSAPAFPTISIEPSRGWVSLNLKELWHYRELIYFLTWRDVKIRYKQTALGVAWAVLQPLLTMLIFSVIFGRLAKIPSDGIPYPIFSLAGVVPWTFFSSGLNFAANSLVASSNMIKKVYFPRLIIPLASLISGFVDLAISLGLVGVMMAWYRVPLTANVLWLPVFALLGFVTALGVGLWLSALNVEYRDVRYVVPFLMQFWMYATPIVYPSSLLKEPWRTVCGLNPMAGVVEGFRWSLLGANTQPGPLIAVSSLMAVLIVVSGAYYFRRMERTFADVV